MKLKNNNNKCITLRRLVKRTGAFCFLWPADDDTVDNMRADGKIIAAINLEVIITNDPCVRLGGTEEKPVEPPAKVPFRM